MDFKLIRNQIIHLEYTTQDEMTRALVRFQEHYESPEFRGKIFTLGQFRDWYAQRVGGFTYYQDWDGFNFPDYVLKPFIHGSFDPLMDDELMIVELFGPRTDKYYIIGTHLGSKDAIDHETAHALFYLSDGYRKAVEKAVAEHDPVFVESLKSSLKQMGYCDEVMIDEVNAYMATSPDYVEEKFPHLVDKKFTKKLKRLFDRHFDAFE